MLRLAKYLKPFTWMILVTIGLLFVQAFCDLALPEYLSKIVNVGIQQGGVETAVPEAIRQSQMNHVLLFVSEADKQRIQHDYQLVDKNSPDYATYLKQYPALANEPVDVLTAVNPEEMTWLNSVMAPAEVAVSRIQEFVANPARAAAPQANNPCSAIFAQIPKGAAGQGGNLFAMLSSLPAPVRGQVTICIDQLFAKMSGSMTTQAAIPFVKNEYKALGMDTWQLQVSYILKTGGLMLAITLLSVACAIGVGFLSARTAAGLARNLRRNVFQKVEGFSSTEFDKFSTASLITRTTNDITQIQMVVIMSMRMVFYAPIIGIGGIIRAFSLDTSMWWTIAVAVGMLLTLVFVVFSLTLPKFRIMQSLIDRLNLVTRENLAGMMVIRAFNMQPFEENRFDKANLDLTSTTLFVSRVMAVMFPVMMLIMNGVSILIIWVGSHQVAAGNMQVGDMIAFMQYAIQIVFSFLMMSFMFIILPRASVSGGRIADVLETEPTILDPSQARAFPEPFKGMVEFRNVSFRYPGAEEDVLHDISFTAKPGQTTAFIGSTGSGKSTVVNLIPRFYDVTQGSILVDGVNIRDVSQHDLRAKIGYVPQKSTLFSGTIESNLRYADENASPVLLDEAAGIAQAKEFIETNPDKMAAEISQGGQNVSGGQKQRLSIARALVKRAPIYIFDDSFSALDFRTDAALRRALKEKMTGGGDGHQIASGAVDGRNGGSSNGGSSGNGNGNGNGHNGNDGYENGPSTLLIVTQRVSTIKNADQIIVLDDGKIVGKGTHRELMNTCETYREIALSQLSAEELG